MGGWFGGGVANNNHTKNKKKKDNTQRGVHCEPVLITLSLGIFHKLKNLFLGCRGLEGFLEEQGKGFGGSPFAAPESLFLPCGRGGEEGGEFETS